MNKLKVGQIIWTLNVNDAARRREQILTEREITKVGSKYFYFKEGHREVKFHIETLREVSNYTSNYTIYLNDQDYYDQKHRYELLSKIKGKLETRYEVDGISLEKLGMIADILEVNDEQANRNN